MPGMLITTPVRCCVLFPTHPLMIEIAKVTMERKSLQQRESKGEFSRQPKTEGCSLTAENLPVVTALARGN